MFFSEQLKHAFKPCLWNQGFELQVLSPFLSHIV